MNTNTELIARLRETASKGVSAWGDLQMEAAKELEIVTAEREAYASAMDRMKAESSDFATIAGLEASVSRLSSIVDEQLRLLIDVEKECGTDGHGGEFEDGESVIIDRVRAHIACYAAPIPQQPSVPDDVLRDAARWKQLAYMEASRVAPSTIAEYIARPDRLDYAGELQRKFGHYQPPHNQRSRNETTN